MWSIRSIRKEKENTIRKGLWHELFYIHNYRNLNALNAIQAVHGLDLKNIQTKQLRWQCMIPNDHPLNVQIRPIVSQTLKQ